MNLLQYVNPLQGTYSHHGFSTGNTLPLVALPFGMAHWSLQTADVRGWFFNPHDRKLMGVRCTHQPSPWMGDYGAFVILPQAGPRLLSKGKRATSYRLSESVVKPHRLSVTLTGSGLQLEMAPTERGAVFEFVFPEGMDSRIILDGVKGDTYLSVRPDGRTIEGYTRGNSGGVPAGFACYFVATLDRDVVSWCTFEGEQAGEPGEARNGEILGLCVELGKSDGQPVTLRVGTSFIDAEQAERNLRTEAGEVPLSDIVAAAETIWEDTLGQIEVHGEEDLDRLRTFYSCLYRCFLFPRVWHETNAEGETVHYSPFDGHVHPGVMYSDTGFWDTYRTLFPLLTLLAPKRFMEMMQGFVNAYKESGWMPQWPSPGHRVSMVGTHLDSVMADAVAKGLTDFDLETALEGMVKHSLHAAPGGSGAGRPGIEEFLKYGFCSAALHASVAQTLDYSYDDWCVAQVARFLGNAEEADRLLKSAGNYRQLYDPAVGFMRAKHADGTWKEPFDEFEWGGPYVEGGAWQSTWAVPHDPAGLMEIMGGEDAFAAKLDQMLETPPYFRIGSYGAEIHEMTEMAMADFGQYAHSNQPVHHVLSLYLAAGRPWRMQKEVRRVLAELYTPDLLPGDEDNGEMAAWYVLNALGLFPYCPGQPDWALSSPIFQKAVVHLPNGQDLTIEAAHNDADKVYVRKVQWNDEVVDGTTIEHCALAEGGRLSFAMSETASEAVVEPSKRPRSFSG